MSATHKRERITDHFQVIPTWEEVSQAESYSLPRLKLPARVGNPPGTEAYPMVFAALVERGAWLQRAVADGWPQVDELAEELSAYAALGAEPYEESQRERIAAAYFLWPYHSARYYGYTQGLDLDQRLESRNALCRIQALLYNNVRGLLDVMRLWFDSFSDVDSGKYVSDSGLRAKWRHARLIRNAPDLCAVDFLAQHMLELVQARPFIRKAIENIQELSLKDREASSHVSDAVTTAFKKLRVAQMTVFYHPKPFDVKERDEIPLYELVHRTLDSEHADAIPAQLIPFDGDPRLASNFRKLASTIYSVKDKKRYPNFSAHRDITIRRLNEATSFISDGAISNHFLSTEPPVRSMRNGNPPSEEAQIMWPLWYSRELSAFEFDIEPPDWSDGYWWRSIESDDLRQLLFPGAKGNVHENHHMSSLWDELVVTERKFVDKIDIPSTPPRGKPTFGYLMELLLRREEETRTSFFFALAQTFGRDNPRLCQFVGGTLLGLERAGVPFSKERFQAIAARMRGLVMAVAHYTTTYALKEERRKDDLERSNYNKRVKVIKDLLRGNDRMGRGRLRGRFPRGGHLLFATPLRGGGVDHDHTESKSQNIGWRPSRYQIKEIFTSAEHLVQSPPAAGDCSNTWKALFYLGGRAGVHNKLQKFVSGWQGLREKDPKWSPGVADRAVACEGCFRAALEFLLQDAYKALSSRIEITPKSIRLPSRPGIRFLITLCRFVHDVHTQARPENTSIIRIEFLPTSVVIDFDKPQLLETIWERKEFTEANMEHTIGIFKLLERGLVEPPRDEYRDPWLRFLNDPQFATPLNFERGNNSQRLTVRW